MGSNEDPSAPLPSFLGCPAISPTGTALWPDQQADGVLGNNRPTRADGQDKGGLRAVEERGGWAGRREADQGAAPHGTQALLLSWFQIHRLTTGVRVLI